MNASTYITIKISYCVPYRPTLSWKRVTVLKLRQTYISESSDNLFLRKCKAPKYVCNEQAQHRTTIQGNKSHLR